MKYCLLSLFALLMLCSCLNGVTYTSHEITSQDTTVVAEATNTGQHPDNIIDSIRQLNNLPDSVVVSRFGLDTFLAAPVFDPHWQWKNEYDLYDSLFVLTVRFQENDELWKEAILVINKNTLKGTDAMLIGETQVNNNNDYYTELDYNRIHDSLYYVTEKGHWGQSSAYFLVAMGKFVIAPDGVIEEILPVGERRPGYRLSTVAGGLTDEVAASKSPKQDRTAAARKRRLRR